MVNVRVICRMNDPYISSGVRPRNAECALRPIDRRSTAEGACTLKSLTALLGAKDMLPVYVEVDAASHTVTIAFRQIAQSPLVVMIPDRVALRVRAAQVKIES
jgi:hypothetical protein